MSPTTAAWLALACPLAGTVINGLGYKVFKGKVPGFIGTAALAAAFVFAVIAFLSLQGRGAEHRQVVSSLYDYAVTGTIDAKMSILVDPLSVLMLLVVTGVSTLIHIYSLAYMSGDRGYTRF
ncbi:MAG: nuoL, partial [Conexibacter sp.]|nr:nuoL [Conexibacter sp.]